MEMMSGEWTAFNVFIPALDVGKNKFIDLHYSHHGIF